MKCCEESRRPKDWNPSQPYIGVGCVAQDPIVQGHGTWVNFHRHVDRHKNHRILESIMAIDQGGDTWRKDNIFLCFSVGIYKGLCHVDDQKKYSKPEDNRL
jgi:hypothetical protein